MTLRIKTMWIVGTALFGLLILLLSVSFSILLKDFKALEQQEVKTNISRLRNVFSQELHNLSVEAEDYAAWDDTYAYMVTRNEEFVKSNLVETTFDALNLHLFILLDIHHQMIFAQSHDPKRHQLVPIPSQFHNYLKLFDCQQKKEDNISGLVLLPQHIMLVASYPILTSRDQGPCRGTLIMGRYLDETELQKLSNLTHLSITLQRLDNPALPQDIAQLRTQLLHQPTMIQAIDYQSIAGYTLLNDIYDNPAIVLQITMLRKIYQRGLASLRIMGALVLIFAVIVSVLILWLFEKLVLSRLAVLNREVMQIGQRKALSTVTIKGQDELAQLATTINQMIQRIRKTEASLAEAQRIVHLGNWDWDVETEYFYCSDEIYRIFGLRPRSVRPSYDLFLNYVHPADQNLVSSVINKAMSEDQSYEIEHRIIQKKGAIRFIHTRGEQLKNEAGEVVHIIGTLQDITERKLAEEQTLRLLEDNHFLISRTLAIKEEERKKLSQELHDEFGQCITAIQADAENIAGLAQENNLTPRCLEKMTFSAEAILEVSTHMYEVVHTLMRQLRPSDLDELGLVDALQELITDWQARHPTIECIFTVQGDLTHLGDIVNISIYRIIQECLTNIRKYAQASKILIRLNTDPIKETLTLYVQDNGCGMNPKHYKRGLGLIGIRERAKALDGQWRLDSAPGQGVKSTLTIPIAEEYLQKHRKWT